MRTIKEMCELLGLSRRTFRYYDYIGLLRPVAYSDAGYRLYDDDSVRQMVKIRLFVDIGYELTEIKSILDDSEYDLPESLAERERSIRHEQEEADEKIMLIERISREGVDEIVGERLKALGFSK